jgi:hypothetical protein
MGARPLSIRCPLASSTSSKGSSNSDSFTRVNAKLALSPTSTAPRCSVDAAQGRAIVSGRRSWRVGAAPRPESVSDRSPRGQLRTSCSYEVAASAEEQQRSSRGAEQAHRGRVGRGRIADGQEAKHACQWQQETRSGTRKAPRARADGQRDVHDAVGSGGGRGSSASAVIGER